MKLGIAAALFMLPACSLIQNSATVETPKGARRAPIAVKRAPERDAAPDGATRSQRRVGDVTVFRFSGDYRKMPLLFTERVVAREAQAWVVDLTLDDGSTSRSLRVRFDLHGRPLSAARIDGEREVFVPIDEYHAFVEPTVFAAEQNDGLLGAERATCLVGEKELDCETKSYRVRVAGKDAKLVVTGSPELPGRDIAGEITTTDGRVVYRAELLSHALEASSSSVAER